MIYIDDLEDFPGSVAVSLIVIIKVEDILKELLGFIAVKVIVLIDIVMVEELFNVLHAFLNTSAALSFESIHVLVEDIGEK